MAFSFDIKDRALVITGFESGIAPTPYSGIANAQNVNLDTVKGEASVNFGTANIMNGTAITTALLTETGSSNNFQAASSLGLETEEAIYVTTSSITGLTSGSSPYWVQVLSTSGGTTTFALKLSYGTTTLSNFTGTTGTAIFYTYNMGKPKQFAYEPTQNLNWVIDDLGQVWTDRIVTTTTKSWTYTGNRARSGPSPDATAHGNGLVTWRAANWNRAVGGWDTYAFVFRDGAIDYALIDTEQGMAPISWTYGWNPDTSTVNQSNYLTGNAVASCPHYPIEAPNGRIYFTDLYKVGKIYQTNRGIGSVAPVAFDPLVGTTYTYLTFPLLPIDDIATCLSPLGTNMLIGGTKNYAYTWDTTSNVVTQPILLAENYVSQIVTVNTNAYIFAGNTGRIYISNGSQANEFAKIPDYIAGGINYSQIGAVAPYFNWGGATYVKNHLLFSAYVVDNAGNAITGYGGVWIINLNSNAMWLSNKLSYNTFGGYASALAPIQTSVVLSSFNGNPPGVGFFAGWYNGTNYGIDKTTTVPASQGVVESDLIPIGTYNIPQNNTYVEYKLATPLVSGESISLYYRPYFGTAWTLIGTDSTAGNFSNTFPSNWSNLNWIQLRAELNSTSTNPSYVRLQQIRIAGFTGPTFGQQPILSV